MTLLARGLQSGTTYTSLQYELVEAALLIGGFALLASALWSFTTRGEIGKRWRPAVVASAVLCTVAALAYLHLLVQWDRTFLVTAETPFSRGGYRPDPTEVFTEFTRYADWAVTVPLLCVELLAVTSLVGDRLRAVRGTAVALALGMVLTGLVGHLCDTQDDRNTGALLVWGTVSTLFYLGLYVVLFRAVRESLATMSERAGTSLRNATVLLFGTWGAYPLLYLVPVLTREDAAAATTVALGFTAADIAAKVGFGALVHRVAKLRTADDALAGDDTLPDAYPAEVFVATERLSTPARPVALQEEPEDLPDAAPDPAEPAGGQDDEPAAPRSVRRRTGTRTPSSGTPARRAGRTT